MTKKPKTLIIAATHGDEKVGLEVIAALLRKGLGSQFDFIVANPFALIADQRFVDLDLNRAYPGDIDSRAIEKILAYKNFQIAERYDYVIDLHEARCGSDNFIIIPREELSGNLPLELINLKTVLLWPEPKGSMAGLLMNAIELEFGMLGKDRAEVIAVATATCEIFLKSLVSGHVVDKEKKDIYEVYGALLESEIPDYQHLSLRDFDLVRVGNEKFYPLLVNQYIKDGIICYKMRKK